MSIYTLKKHLLLYIVIGLITASPYVHAEEANAADNFDDELNDIYDQITEDNDSSYISTTPQQFEPATNNQVNSQVIPNNQAIQNNQQQNIQNNVIDDDLSVYEDFIYDENGGDNDSSYRIIDQYNAEEEVLEPYYDADGQYVAPYDNDSNYLPSDNIPPNDQYFDNSPQAFPQDNDQDYTPSNDAYPDYYNL